MTYNTIAETQNYIVLDEYTKLSKVSEAPATYQSENALEREFIEDLIAQGYEYLPQLTTCGTLGQCTCAAASSQRCLLLRCRVGALL